MSAAWAFNSYSVKILSSNKGLMQPDSNRTLEGLHDEVLSPRPGQCPFFTVWIHLVHTGTTKEACQI